MQRFAKMCKIIDKVNTYDDYEFTFVTLTVKNVPINNLRDEILRMSAAWNRLRKRKDFEQIQDGWARSVEVTYNELTKTFHPHYHIIIAHSKAVTIDVKALENLFRALWRDTCNLSYSPQVNVKKIDKLKGKEAATADEQSKAVLECFKYPMKPFEDKDMSLGIFRRLVEQIAGLRMVAFGGIFKTAKRELGLNLEDVDAGEEIEQPNCESCGTEMMTYIYKWSEQNAGYATYRKDT